MLRVWVKFNSNCFLFSVALQTGKFWSCISDEKKWIWFISGAEAVPGFSLIYETSLDCANASWWCLCVPVTPDLWGPFLHSEEEFAFQFPLLVPLPAAIQTWKRGCAHFPPAGVPAGTAPCSSDSRRITMLEPLAGISRALLGGSSLRWNLRLHGNSLPWYFWQDQKGTPGTFYLVFFPPLSLPPPQFLNGSGWQNKQQAPRVSCLVSYMGLHTLTCHPALKPPRP